MAPPPGYDPAEVYAGAPLRAVAIEVGFPTLLDAVSRFGAFQRRHPELDRVWEAQGDPPSHDGREFARAATTVLRNDARAVSIASDRLAAVAYTYDGGFRGFKSWAMPLLVEGLACIDTPTVASVRFRYENRIEHDTRNVSLGSMFRLTLAAPPGADDLFAHLHLVWRQKWPRGSVEVELEACDLQSEDRIRLNITATTPGTSRPVGDLEQLVDDAHDRARATFEELITSSFRERLRAGKEHSDADRSA